MKHLFTVFFCLILFSSCSPILGLYGVRNPKEISEKKIIRYSKRVAIPKDAIYELDTSYFSFLASLKLSANNLLNMDSVKIIERKNQVKNHYQPLQALYFNKSGKLESFQINCYAGGFPNLKWDRDRILSTFPPKIQAPLDTLLSESEIISFLKPLVDSKEIKTGNYDYLVYVFYNKFMGRQNKRFINFIQKNSQLSNEKNIRVIYITMDNAYAISGIW